MTSACCSGSSPSTSITALYSSSEYSESFPSPPSLLTVADDYKSGMDECEPDVDECESESDE